MYFAWVKEKVGVSEETVSPPGDVKTVADLVAWLGKRSPAHEAAFSDKRTIKAAVDQVHSPMTASIAGAKEVAFFPPVTGG
jgi:molybdopterin synthase sulfur carrier subunit